MKPLRGVGWGCALAFLASTATPAHAAWCNVFQVCCASCGHASASAYGPDPCCNPCPQPVCTTRYVQRCYYQPVTTYESRSYYEPVTTYRTSYYYEPVTSYRYSCYYDPCTCSYQQVACPTTSYRLRSQCCPVQSWVQRCCQVPVTSYRQCSYWEPLTSCSTPAPCCPTSAEAGPPPAQPAIGTPPGPAVSEGRAAPSGPAVQEYPGTGASAPPAGGQSYDRYYPQTPEPPPAQGSSLRQEPRRLRLQAPAPAPAPPKVRLEGIVALPSSTLEGQVVRRDRVPQAGARVWFVSATRQGPREAVTADAAGKFRVSLAAGNWLVYVTGPDGRPVFDRKLEVRENEARPLTLVSR